MDAGRDDPSAPGAQPGHQAPPSNSGPINLSGLVCNVRRTTGREPHPLVGATTTILGDKLYVFGGRVLSKSRPQLTSDIYELDLIRRHYLHRLCYVRAMRRKLESGLVVARQYMREEVDRICYAQTEVSEVNGEKGRLAVL